MNALLGTFTTPFTCRPPRVTNIRLIAKTVDRTLIGPRESFSLNGSVGKRTKEKGYVEAPFILDGELSKDIGAGVSQFATMTLNAAFAGLRLNQHQAHSFYISRYPLGAKRRSTTTGPSSPTVALYGQRDGRVVQAVSGPRKPLPGRDFKITVNRVISIPGRPAQRDSYTTRYTKAPEHE